MIVRLLTIFTVMNLGLAKAIASGTCPNLTGTYQCQYNGMTLTATVETKTTKTNDTYYIFTAAGETIEIHADGKLHAQKTTKDFPHLVNRKYSAHCLDNKVHYWEQADISAVGGQILGQHFQLAVRSADTKQMNVDFLDMRDVFTDGLVDHYAPFSHSCERQ